MTTSSQEATPAEALIAETNWMYALIRVRENLPRAVLLFLSALVAWGIWAATWNGPRGDKLAVFLTIWAVTMLIVFSVQLWLLYQVQRSKSILVLLWRKPIWTFCLLNAFAMPFLGRTTPLMELYVSLCTPLLVVMVILTAYQNHRSPDLFDWHKMIQEERLQVAQEEQVNNEH